MAAPPKKEEICDRKKKEKKMAPVPSRPNAANNEATPKVPGLVSCSAKDNRPGDVLFNWTKYND